MLARYRRTRTLELRHLRYFVAAAEAGSLKLAAEEKLHTTQPSLSRQIRDLEAEVGTALLVRGSKGVELTPAGRLFLDHARVMLSQARRRCSRRGKSLIPRSLPSRWAL
ncbi:MAG: LysR family transcriptional regulator [Acidobacteriota bacterium]